MFIIAIILDPLLQLIGWQRSFQVKAGILLYPVFLFVVLKIQSRFYMPYSNLRLMVSY